MTFLRHAAPFVPVALWFAWAAPLLAQQGTTLDEPPLRHYAHVFWAYALAWLFVIGWVVSIGRRLAAVASDLRDPAGGE